jgi:hypothetical protein
MRDWLTRCFLLVALVLLVTLFLIQLFILICLSNLGWSERDAKPRLLRQIPPNDWPTDRRVLTLRAMA